MFEPMLSPDSEDSYGADSWISDFCAIPGNEIFTEVPEEFIEDDFNLTGLSHLVPNYSEALDFILDLEPDTPMQVAKMSIIEKSAKVLYGLIHARFIVSRVGLQAMAHKYDYNDFGSCPRVLCNSMRLLPTGRYDRVGCENVRMYCPCCMDLYVPQSSRFASIDGAYFGTSFVGLFLKTFPSIEKECIERRKKQFSLSIYGFKISEFSEVGPRMKWLRQVPENEAELDEDSEQEDEKVDAHVDSDDEDKIEEDSLKEETPGSVSQQEKNTDTSKSYGRDPMDISDSNSKGA